jgi:WD40 repeat protein
MEPGPDPPIVDSPTRTALGSRISIGEVLAGRYELRELLGHGGMGEVWRAFDLKLRVEVALKALLAPQVAEERGRELIRREVRVARAVVSPNVCRIFDLVEIEDQELVSMELVDGVTLLRHLREHGPLDLSEASRIAAQLLAGLDAIHEAGLVHRDVKPENVMITRAGRVVLMDFGIAKGIADAGGTVVGTPAYMAPEQARGQAVDARADVFAAGVVLAEMMAPRELDDTESRASLRAGLHEQPPRVPEGPWSKVIRRAVAKDSAERYPSARALARALEEITRETEDASEQSPYPGLASFTEDDARFFFGREAEVEAVWRKLRSQHLLAVVGPSGAGKSSFLRAGLLATLPASWSAIVMTPGSGPYRALGRALVPEVSGDAEAMALLVDIADPDAAVAVCRSWRHRHEEALLVVDQLEELFTLNPPDVQGRFAELLSRLALEADVRVLLAMRDDFLIHCDHEALAPIFSELTLLRAPTGTALRRALVQPALQCGYRFEDEAMVEEMLGEVESERGALPLLAFAAAALWKRRDRERSLLTREAYLTIGGVSGALAQHAEATLDRIGAGGTELVRELFRNLVTAQGTRAVRDREDLLSVLERRAEAERVLGALIDARLLTTFEVPGDADGGAGQQPRHRVEIIHESLLQAWPRLVRWQTQDADAAGLRDQLRQAAQLWEERSRAEDLLWTGTSYREYQLWRERYPGRLSASEEAFARAMVGRAERVRRRRRVALATTVGAALLVAFVTSSLWRAARVQAVRAEANKLLALGQRALDSYATGALAFAIKSLELADTREARRFVDEVLWSAPVQRIVELDSSKYIRLAVSPDGEWLAAAGKNTALVLSREGIVVRAFEHPASGGDVLVDFAGNSHLVTSVNQTGVAKIWSLPDGELVRTIEVAPRSPILVRGESLLTFSWITGPLDGEPSTLRVEAWPLGPGEPESFGLWVADLRRTVRRELDGPVREELGSILGHFYGSVASWDVDPSGQWIAFIDGASVYRQQLDQLSHRKATKLLSHDHALVDLRIAPSGERLFLRDADDRFMVWSIAGDSPKLERALEGAKQDAFLPDFDSESRWLAWGSQGERKAYLWDLEAPPDALPVELAAQDVLVRHGVVDPRGEWLATVHNDHLAFWSLRHGFVRRLPNVALGMATAAFTTDGRHLATCHRDGGLRVLPMHPAGGSWRWVDGFGMYCASVAAHPTRSELLVSAGPPFNRLRVHSLDDGSSTDLSAEPWTRLVGGVTWDQTGRRLAATAVLSPEPARNLLHVFSLDTRTIASRQTTTQSLEGGAWGRGPQHPRFLPDGDLVTDGIGGVQRWDLDTGEHTTLVASPQTELQISRDGTQLAVIAGQLWDNGAIRDTRLFVLDLETGQHREIVSHGDGDLQDAVFDPSGEILVTADWEGTVRVGPVNGEAPHQLPGHSGNIAVVQVSPDGRWVVSNGGPDTRLWPMPDVSERPLHTLPLEELLARLRALTNVRVVEDASSSEGWKLEVGPFDG